MLSFAALKQFKSVKLVLISKKTSQILTATMIFFVKLCTGTSESKFSFLSSSLQKKSVPAEQYRFFKFRNSIEIRCACLHVRYYQFFSRHIYQGHIKSMWYCRQKCRLFRAAWPVKSKTLCRPTLKPGCKKLFIRQYLMNSVL